MTAYTRMGAAYLTSGSLGTAVNTAQNTNTDADAAGVGAAFGVQMDEYGDRFIRSFDAMGKGVDKATGWLGDRAASVYGWATGLPLIGGVVGGGVQRVGDALSWADRYVWSPVTDAVTAYHRNMIDQSGGNIFATAAQEMNVANLVAFIGGEAAAAIGGNPDDTYFARERENGYTLGQVGWELWSGKGVRNPTTGRTEFPLLDDPSKRDEREAYFHDGPQRFVTGIFDVASSIALDPTLAAGAVIKGSVRGATSLTSEGIEQAARTSRGAAVEAAKYQPDALAALTRTQLREEAKVVGVTGASKMTKADLVSAIQRGAQEKFPAVWRDGAVEAGAVDEVAERLGMAPRNLKTNMTKVVEYVHDVVTKADSDLIKKTMDEDALRGPLSPGATLEARTPSGVIKAIADDKILSQSSEAGAAARTLAWIPTIVKDKEVALGLMEDVGYALAGSREALERVGRFSAKLEYDVRVLSGPDLNLVRRGLMQDPSIPYSDALLKMNDDALFKRFQTIATDDLVRGFDEIKRVQAEGLGQISDASRAAAGARGAAGSINRVPLRTTVKNTLHIGKTIKPTRYGPAVHLLQGLRLPNTIQLDGPAAAAEFQQHAIDTIRALAPNRVRGSKKALGANPQDVELLNRYVDEFVGGRIPGSGADMGTATLARKDVFERFERAAFNTVVRNRVNRLIADPKNPLTEADAAAVRVQVEDWANAYLDGRRAQIEAMQTTADRVVKSSKPELVDLGVGNEVYALDLDVARVSSHTSGRVFRADWDDLDRFLEKKFRFDGTYKDVNFRGESVKQWARDALDEANGFMKFSLLLRPIAYPVRIQLDTQSRLIAQLGVYNYAMFAAKGLGNSVRNLRKVPKDAADLYGVKLNAWYDKHLAEQEFRYRNFQVEETKAALGRATASKKSQRELRERLAELEEARDLARQQSLAQDEVIDLTLDQYRLELMQRANKKPKQQIDEALAKIHEAEERLARLESVKRKGEYTLDRIRRTRQEIENMRSLLAQAEEKWTTSLPITRVRRGKTAAKRVQGHSGTIDLRTGKFTPPDVLEAYARSPFEIEHLLEADQRQSTHNLYSSSSREFSFRSVKMHRSVRSYGTTPEAQAAYNKTYAAMVNQHIRNDPGFQRLLHGEDPEDVVRWMRETPEGREYYRALGGVDFADGPSGLVGEQMAVMDDLLPAGLRERARARDLTPEEIEDFWDDVTGEARLDHLNAPHMERPEIRVEDRVENPLIPIAGNTGTGEAVMASFRAIQRQYFHKVSEIPEMFLGRHPMFKHSYDQRIDDLLSSRGFTRENASKTLTLDEINRLRAEAHRLARKDMLDVMFDTSRQTNLQHAVRWLIPFYSAWEDVMVKWGRIVGQNPYAGVATARAFESTTSLAQAFDQDGNIILPNGEVHTFSPEGEIGDEILYYATPNDGYLVWNMPTSFADKTGVTSMKFNRGSLNSVFQGENPFVPGAGPLVAVPTNQIVTKGLPFIPMDDATWMTETPGVKNFVEWALPYGQSSESTAWQLAPTWARNLATAIGAETGSPNGGAVQAYDRLMVQQMNAERNGLTPTLTTAEREAKVFGQMKTWWWFKFLGSEIPVSTQPGSRLEFYADEFHRYREKYGKDAEEKFHEDYPQAKEVTISWSMNNTGIQASEEAWAAVAPWRQQIANAPGTGFIYAGPANYLGEFSDSVYEAQKAQTISPSTETKFRDNRDIATASETIDLERGWSEWSKFNHQLDAAMEEYGVKSLNSEAGAEFRLLKDAYLEKLKQENPSWYQEYSKGFSAGDNPPVWAMSKVYTSLVQNPDKVMKSGQSEYYMKIIEYVEARNTIREVMRAQGMRSADSETFRSSELGLLWGAYITKLTQESPAFADMYYKAGWDRDDLVDEVVVN